jgi:hypothetical protein
MSIEGFFKVDFSASILGAGGVISVENGNVRGGDDQYLYSGTVSGPDNALRAELTVAAYVPGAVSVFNAPDKRFRLTLTGTATGDSFQFSGSAPHPGHQGITIRGKRIASISLD